MITMLCLENGNCEHELSVVVPPANDPNDVPLALRNLVTQTDKDGNFTNQRAEVNC